MLRTTCGLQGKYRLKHVKQNMHIKHIKDIFRIYRVHPKNVTPHVLIAIPTEEKQLYIECTQLLDSMLQTSNNVVKYFITGASMLNILCCVNVW